MLMEAKSLIKQVENTKEFLELKEKKQNLFLAHVFAMYDGDKLMDTQVGYYDNDTKKMSSFLISDDKVQLLPETDVFQKPGSEVKSIAVEKISLEFDQVKQKSEELLSSKYSLTASKKVFILQTVGDDQVWNITFLTNSFSTINIRVDSVTSEILKDEVVNLVDFSK